MLHSSHVVNKFDAVSVLLHWLIALLVVSLFGLGVWMVELDYYHDWYYRAPWWHKGLGLVLFIMVITRWVWSLIRVLPQALASIPLWQQGIARLIHGILNLLILMLAISGYLMVTLKGDGLMVFDWFALPSLPIEPDWVDYAGKLHKWMAYLLIGVALLHVLAALKHHFIDKDATLLRMLAIEKGNKQ